MRGTSNYSLIKNRIDKLLEKHKTSNPFILASHLNIYIQETNVDPEVFKARVYYFDNDEKGIMLNKNLDEKTKKILIAHEIGHAILHKDFFYYYGCSCSEEIEYEANLFALELLSRSMCLDITQINCLTIQNIIDSILDIKDCC